MISGRTVPGVPLLDRIFEFIDQAMSLAHIARAAVGTGRLKRAKLLDQLPAHRRSRRQELQKMDEPLARRVADQMLDLAAVDFSLRFGNAAHAAQLRLDDDALRHPAVPHLESRWRQLSETSLVGLHPPALLQSLQVDRDTAPRDVEVPGDIVNVPRAAVGSA